MHQFLGASVYYLLWGKRVKVLVFQSYLILCVAPQAPLSMEFSSQEYQSGLPFPSPGDLPDPGIEPGSSAFQADSLPSEPQESESESEVAQSCLTLCDPMDSSLHQAPPSMGFSRQEYWSGLPFPSSGNLPNPGIEPRSLTL